MIFCPSCGENRRQHSLISLIFDRSKLVACHSVYVGLGKDSWAVSQKPYWSMLSHLKSLAKSCLLKSCFGQVRGKFISSVICCLRYWDHNRLCHLGPTRLRHHYDNRLLGLHRGLNLSLIHLLRHDYHKLLLSLCIAIPLLR